MSQNEAFNIVELRLAAAFIRPVWSSCFPLSTLLYDDVSSIFGLATMVSSAGMEVVGGASPMVF
jgi:hypothetical protein